MKEILGDRVDFYRIILERASSAFDFSEKANLNFKIYVTVDVERFIQSMIIKLNLAQTILYSKKGVKYLRLGDLEGNESVNLSIMAKEMI